MTEFLLDPRLEADCIRLGTFPLSLLLLMNDANFPWFILVPQRAGLSEIYELDQGDRRQLCEESTLLAEGLARSFAADKINVAALGNVVSQLHVHHIVRYKSDCAWPAPVWGSAPPLPYTPARLAELKSTLRSMLSETSGFQPNC
jgi:diadenosine tetraphosphate (Ap4A) HIT family hydrolase